jgi:hypothetical protein
VVQSKTSTKFRDDVFGAELLLLELGAQAFFAVAEEASTVERGNPSLERLVLLLEALNPKTWAAAGPFALAHHDTSVGPTEASNQGVDCKSTIRDQTVPWVGCCSQAQASTRTTDLS